MGSVIPSVIPSVTDGGMTKYKKITFNFFSIGGLSWGYSTYPIH